MDPRIRAIARKICEDFGIPLMVTNIGNSYYLYKDTKKWDKEKKKHVRGSEYIGRIYKNGPVEKNRRLIYEFGNSQLLLHWSRILFRN